MTDFISKAIQALSILAGTLDWGYVVMFFITAYSVVKYFTPTAKWKKWYVLITGVVLAIVFGIMYKYSGGFPWYVAGTLPYAFSIILSFLVATFLNKWVGLEKFLDKVVGKVENAIKKKG